MKAANKKETSIDSSANSCLEQFNQQSKPGLWTKIFANILVRMAGWRSPSCSLSWKLKETKFKRRYFKLHVLRCKDVTGQPGLLPTVVAWDGKRGGELVTSRAKIRASGLRYSASLSDLAKSGLLPTPTTGSNRNSRNAVQRIGTAHQNHGVSLGLAQVIEIATGTLPKEFDSWEQVSLFYRRLLPVPLSLDYIEGRHPEDLKPSASLSGIATSGLLPTPTAGVYNTSNMGNAAMDKRIKDGRQEDLNMKLYKITGQTGKLNPLFIMEMMGFPFDWTLIPFLKSIF